MDDCKLIESDRGLQVHPYSNALWNWKTLRDFDLRPCVHNGEMCGAGLGLSKPAKFSMVCRVCLVKQVKDFSIVSRKKGRPCVLSTRPDSLDTKASTVAFAQIYSALS